MKKRDLSTFILIIIIIAGFGILVYPNVADWWNTRAQRSLLEKYDEVVADMDEEDYEQEFEKAEKYNDDLAALSVPIAMYDEVSGYEEALNVGGNGIMGEITIPKINIELPIYHGTSNAVLSVAVGHMEGTSLPIGGEGTHAVLSAHRGLPSAVLFSNLDKLAEGDIFVINILNRTLTYEVDRIRIVEPNDSSELGIVEGEDYVTLLTCTPYGLNTQRLLVRGTRTENIDSDEVIVPNDAIKIDGILVAPIIGAMLFAAVLIFLGVRGKLRKKKKRIE